LLSAIGIFLTYTGWRWSERANMLKKKKYDRCRRFILRACRNEGPRLARSAAGSFSERHG
jgi:hypothetical protein